MEGSAEQPIVDCMVVVAVPYSERALSDALGRIHEAVGSEVPFDASLDIRNGRIVLGTKDDAAAERVKGLLGANGASVGFPLDRIVVEGSRLAQPA